MIKVSKSGISQFSFSKVSDFQPFVMFVEDSWYQLNYSTDFSVIWWKKHWGNYSSKVVVKKEDQFSHEFEEISLYKSVSSGWHTSTGCQPDETGLLLMEAFFYQLIS